MTQPAYCSRRIAALVLGKNDRTLKRWCDDGELESRVEDASGRAMVSLSAVLSRLEHSPDPDLPELILEADQGDAAAQNDLGMLLLQEGRPGSAFELFQESAQLDYPEAMHWLYQCYMKGLGVERDENLAMMWLHQAAAHGHAIAKAQADALRDLAMRQLQSGAGLHRD